MNLNEIGAVLESLHLSVENGLQIVESEQIAAQHNPRIEPTMPLLLLNGQPLEVMQPLLNCYPPAHEIILITCSQGEQIEQRVLQLSNLHLGLGLGLGLELGLETKQKSDDKSGPEESNNDINQYIYVPPLEEGGSFTALLDIVAHLRAPEGCPWDREQTIATLRHDLLDEAAEVVEAIDAEIDGTDNTAHIVEELGDLLLLPAMITQIAAEEGRFQMSEVTRGIVKKLIRRHPHVFGNIDTDDVDEIVLNWDAIKAQEKAERGEAPAGPLDGVPASLPALEKARKYQSKAKKAGLLDRTQLVQDATLLWEQMLNDPNEETMGEMLWSLVAVAHMNDLNAENALRSHIVRFRSKYT